MLCLYIYLAVALSIGLFACFRAGIVHDDEVAFGGCVVALVWPFLLAVLIIWLPFGGAYWFGQKWTDR